MIRFRLSALVLLLAAGTTWAADPLPLRQALAPEEFAAMGLDKLDEAELARLEAWLARRDAKTGETAVRAARAEAPEIGRRATAPARTEQTARIVGTFRGWRGDGDVFELENGQRWQVSNTPTYTAPRPSEAPQATITPGSLGSWFMRVEGHPVRARVTRID